LLVIVGRGRLIGRLVNLSVHTQSATDLAHAEHDLA